ncbi:Phytoene desaturase [Penicillium odoratum]|uniref:Phytoene desaturase n=1 Tax=Penicillium odoratum TaxID=1167516 RepID=UPI0025499841|nr:Phytoene desaturase [Penicillium odoratum]KAJ5772220.1 Phytoene desaturase [Penicillium odoratum]
MLMTEIFEETFQHLGTCMSSEGIELLKCEPNCKIWFEDEGCFATSTDIAHMKLEIEDVEGPSGFERFVAFLEECQRHYEQSLIHVLKKDFPSFLSLLRPAFLPYLFQLHPFQNVWQRASVFFTSHKVRQVFSIGSMYLGMSPFEIPGTYTLLQYAELAGGVWYPRGGFHKVVEKLVLIGKRLGVEYHLSHPVKAVTVSRGKALGVSVDFDKLLKADAVVINADLTYAYKSLLPSDSSSWATFKKGNKVSCSSISFYWSLSTTIPQLETHNMFVESSFGQQSTQIYLKRQGSMKASFYVHVPSRIDPSAAPAGKDALVVLVLVDNLAGLESCGEVINDTNLVSYVRDHVISSIQQRTGAIGVKKLIDHEIVNTPLTWQGEFNSDKGGIFGIDHSFFNILSFRPKIKHESVEGVYFVGASTHPGAGVPTCLAGARLTAERVLKDLDVPIPWEIPTPKRNYAWSRFFTPISNHSSWKWVLFVFFIGIALAGFFWKL